MDIYEAYKKAKAPRYAPNWKKNGGVYQTSSRSALQQARYAIEAEKIRKKWEELGGEYINVYDSRTIGYDRHEDDPVIRIVEFPDEELCLDDLAGDMFDPKANPDINPNKLKREEQKFIDRVNRDGVWCYVAQFWNGDAWEYTDSIGGFVGDDFINSGYDIDLMRSAIEAYEKYVKEKQESV